LFLLVVVLVLVVVLDHPRTMTSAKALAPGESITMCTPTGG
jgi:hypothetical protein